MSQTLRCTTLVLLGTACGLFAPSQAQGGIGSYLRDYRLGFDFSQSSGDFAVINYETNSPTPEEESCTDINGAGKHNCYAGISGKMKETTYIGPINVNDFSVFLEHPFKRQGFFYLGLDVALSFKTFEGDAYLSAPLMEGEPIPPSYKSMTIHAYGGTVRPVIKFGITPKYFFDLFLSVGSGLNIIGGNYKMGDRRETLYLLQRTASFEFEVVYFRFGDGYISSYLSTEGSGTTTRNYSRSINDHWITSIDYNKRVIGFVKILLPWPK